MKNTTPLKHNIRILAVSDYIDKMLTQQVEDKTLDPVDLILSCGDMEPEYLSFLRDRLDRPLYYIKGNHDIRYKADNPMGCANIHSKIVRFKSLNIMGLEGSIWYNGGQNQYTDQMMKTIIKRMWFPIWWKGGIHIVITHAPPRHIHDREDRCHMGFDSFKKLIKKRKPQYLIHGHIHGEFENMEQRSTVFDATKVINTCGYSILEV
ncbi:MAG: Icc-like protein [Desulfobacteraceae bacterium]|nr:Icc-like protein [Desulfobacteraceae bacterium]